MKPTTLSPLTPTEWANWGYVPGAHGVFVHDPHKCAALALRGQPFGFTRFDARNLWHAADTWDVTPEVAAWLRGLSERIDALLPPEGQ